MNMTVKEFFDAVKITDGAECNCRVCNDGKCHEWVEWGTIEIDGELHEVKICYWLEDDQMDLPIEDINWDSAFLKAVDYDIDGENKTICEYED